ncbi:universal stress protein [Salinibaculum salinum]|uniref:universal stress protein n=1 Tax=Salinibaculum salinum TaxID=3131996 RepID=UPI0030EE9B18
MYQTILLPTDGSEQSKLAEKKALRLAEQFGAELHALHVIDTRHMSEPALSAMELITDEAEDRAMDLLKDIVETGEESGLDVTTRCCHGVPQQEILSYADEIDADLIVMGYRGHTHDKKMGSVVNRVLNDTDRQVLTV